MTDTRIPRRNPRYFFRGRRAISAVTLAAMAGLSALFPALAGPPLPGDSFAHKYTPVYGEAAAKTHLALMVHAPSFQTLIEAQPDPAAGMPPSGSSAASTRERRPRLSVRQSVSRSGSSSVPGRASSCASAIGRSTPVCWRPRPVRWRLWSPTATTRCSLRGLGARHGAARRRRRSSHGCRAPGFQVGPVMRLAAESDPAAFKTFVRRLEQIRVTTVTTPRLLIDE